ncbi:MAG TPA: alpha/beta fold hydrolase [Thermodesulfobacteriota bacterium]
MLHAEAWLDLAPRGAPAVVLVHGLGVSHRYLRPLGDRLALRARVYAPDLPGFGASPAPPGRPLDVPELAAALAGFLDAARIGPATFVGNSMGCQVIAELAAGEPARVTRAVLNGPTIDPCARTAVGQIARLLLDALREPPGLVPLVVGDYLRCGPARLWQTFRHALRHPMADTLTRVTAPTVVVRGSRDPLVSRRWAETASRLLPRGRLVELPGVAHAAVYSAPRRLARVVCPPAGGPTSPGR